MSQFERWPDYAQQNWQQRFVTLDARYKEPGDNVMQADRDLLNLHTRF